MKARMVEAYNLRKLRLSGILPRYIDGTHDAPIITKDKIDKTPFSQQYKSYKEYQSDVNLSFELLKSGTEIPDELFNKLRLTAQEIGLIEAIAEM